MKASCPPRLVPKPKYSTRAQDTIRCNSFVVGLESRSEGSGSWDMCHWCQKKRTKSTSGADIDDRRNIFTKSKWQLGGTIKSAPTFDMGNWVRLYIHQRQVDNVTKSAND